MGGFRRIAVALGALAGLAGAPTGAVAGVTCDYAQSGTFLEVRIDGISEIATVGVSGATIVVRQGAGAVACTSNPAGLTPTVTNVDVVAITAVAGTRATVIIDDAALFTPGATPESGTDEVEFVVNLRDVPGSLLSVRAGDAAAAVVWGTSGINMNAGPGELFPDVDITVLNVDRLDGRGGFAVPVDLRANGGAGTGGPLTEPIDLQGSSAADVLVGGEGNDRLQAFGGADVLLGQGGDDIIDPGQDADAMDGGDGRDVLDHGTRNYPGGVTVDLSQTGQQQTGASGIDSMERIEDVIGTPHNDVLIGGAGPNRLVAGSGIDVVDGGPGPDDLLAGPGNDIVRVRDGQADAVDCGAGTDEVSADAVGVDALTDCEAVDFTPATVVPPPTADGGAIAPAPVVVVAAPDPPALSALRIAPRALPALASGPAARTSGPGARVRFTLDRAASVGFRVARRVAGRRAGGRCAALRPANRLAPRCTRLVTLRGSFTRAGAAGPNAFRFTGRLRGRALPAGAYALLATPRADGLTGHTARRHFSIRG